MIDRNQELGRLWYALALALAAVRKALASAGVRKAGTLINILNNVFVFIKWFVNVFVKVFINVFVKVFTAKDSADSGMPWPWS